MILPVLILGLLGCRTTLRPEVEVPDASAAAEWDRVLSDAVDRDGYVDYGRIARKKPILDRYVAWIGRDRALRGVGGAGAKAYWINAFNALVIYQVLERDRPASVLDVPGLPWEGSGFFFWTEFVLDGNLRLSLWELGNERVIEAWQDYRDFGTLTVASRSSPPLRAGLYDPGKLDDQIDEAFGRWMMDDRGVRFDGDRALFNPIFDRYRDEVALFTHHADPCTIAMHHTSGPRKERLRELADDGCPHDFFAFDWRLNDSAAVGGGDGGPAGEGADGKGAKRKRKRGGKR